MCSQVSASAANGGDEELVMEVMCLVKEVKSNLQALVQEWKHFQPSHTALLADSSNTTSSVGHTAVPATLPSTKESAASPLQHPPNDSAPPLDSPLQPPPLDSPVKFSLLQPPPFDSPVQPSLLKSPPPLDSPFQSPPCKPLPHNSPPHPFPVEGHTIIAPFSSKPIPLVQFPRSDLDRLTSEAMMLKELLPTILNDYYLSCVAKFPSLEGAVGRMRRERDGVMEDCKRLRKQQERLRADYEKEVQEKYAIKNEVQELQGMLTQQADYCSSMGSACCMLLWRVSRHEECIQSILSGSKVSEFLQLTGRTLLSFLEAYQDSAPPDETHPEAQFVLSLCGTITNIAASTYGRDFLCNCEDGVWLIETLCSVLGTTPLGQQYSKLRSLILMSLYNISINRRGIKHLTARPKLLQDLVWLIQGEADTENQLHILKLIQSAILEPDSATFISKALDVIPVPLIQHLSTDVNPEIQSVATELLGDLTSLRRHSASFAR